jgi:hypothetical protein
MSNKKRQDVQQNPSGVAKPVKEKKKKALVVVDGEGASTELRDLTTMQAAFVHAFTCSAEAAGDPTKAAREAGYAESAARDIGRQLLEKPHVVAEIDAKLREEIGTRLTVKAVRVIEKILDNEEASLKLKGDMAVKILDYSGLADRTRVEKERTTGIAKPLGEQTRDELAEMVRQAALFLAGNRAQVINANVSAPNSAQQVG